MNCADVDDHLLEFVEGELAPPDAEQLRSHVRDCPTCDAKLRDYRQMCGALSVARSVDNRVQRPENDPGKPCEPDTHRGHKRIGDFEIVGELGRGGMGVVYRARQLSLHRVVALKILAAGAVHSDRAIRRFQHEAQAAARLHHTNIVPIYAQGESDGCYYYAMELVEGRSLSQILRDDPDWGAAAHTQIPSHQPAPSNRSVAPIPTDQNGPAAARSADRTLQLESVHLDVSAPPARVHPTSLSGTMSRRSLSGILHRPRSDPRKFKRIARLFAEVAEGLAHAHAQSIVHRDIKPQNLLLGPDDKLHITDFGLARLLDEPGMTMTSEILGTPAYMSPEQIAGGRFGVDHRTDIYSLGVTLYETLTRQRPFNGATYERVVSQVVNHEPTAPRRIDPLIPLDLETICTRAMEKSPARRFATAAELAADLRRYASDFPIQSRRITSAERAVRWMRRNKVLTSLLCTSAVIVVVAPLLWSYVRSVDRVHIDRAYDILLEDYRESDKALGELAKKSWFTAQTRESRFVQALATVGSNPGRTRSLLEPWTAQHPDDSDALYLLGWSYSRLARDETELQKRIRECVNAADRSETASGAGFFFRGQAMLSSDIDEALKSFRKAIDLHPRTFPQAMLHRARALNQLMYVFRDDQYLSEADATLSTLTDLRPGHAYAAYLHSSAHRIRAEILADRAQRASDPDERANLRDEAMEAYEKSVSIASAAREQDPSSPYPYMQAAHTAESIALHFEPDPDRLRDAVSRWNEMPDSVARASASSARERSTYLMRLYFWLGDYAAARREAVKSYERPRADLHFFQAIISHAAEDENGMHAALKQAAELSQGRPEDSLIAYAAHCMCNVPAPSPLLDVSDCAKSLPVGWSAEWACALLAFARGEENWERLVGLASAGDSSRLVHRRRLASAWFVRAARAFQQARESDALIALQACAKCYDFENYCFSAKFLLVKHSLDR